MGEPVTLGRHRGKFCAVTGKGRSRRRHSLGTSDPSLARTRFAEFLRQFEQAQRPALPTIGEIADAYLADRDREALCPKRLREAWAQLAATFRDILPSHVTKELCRNYVRDRTRKGRPVSTGTSHTELSMLRAALRWAERERWIEHAPPVWLPQKPPPRERHLSRAEATKLVDAAEMPHVRLFVLLALNTGARMGAILDLRWPAVDLDRKRINLSRQDGRQTRKGRAVVPINAILLPALQEAKEAALSPFVIEWGGGQVKSIKKGFGAAVKRAGVAPCTPHVMRHTAAVWMAEAGVPMPVIAQYLGHTDSRITERVYARFSPDYLSGAASALAGA